MLVLHTKDGSRVGNAILYGGERGYSPPPDYKVRKLFLVETDFGNKMRLTWNEVNELFTISHVEDYEIWKQERTSKQHNEFEPDSFIKGLPHGPRHL